MLNRRTVVTLLVGLALGFVLALIARPFLDARLPEAMSGKRELLSGPVTAKQRTADRVLLTVDTPAGASLATFKARVDEIDLLVEAGDTVTLSVPAYRPFLEDPQIARVAKAGPTRAGEAVLPDTTPPPSDSLAQPTDTVTSAPTGSWFD